MKNSVAAAIAEYQQYRHANNTEQPTCKHCGSFVDKGTPQHGQYKYTCNACGRAVLEYTGQKRSTAQSD